LGRLAEPAGAFVTIRCAARLRGCIGRTQAAGSLAETVAQCAISAALHDPRFPPIGKDELSQMNIEISVLSELRPASADEIEPGTHGVFVSRGAHRGLLLPQVAAEHNWPPERFLEETCVKAGLEPAAWRHPETKLFAFTVEGFGEGELANHEIR
jgi:AmmeMemoRadiSam system protein A